MKKRQVNKGKTARRDKLTPDLWNQLERFQALSMRMAGYLHQVKTPLHVIQSQAEFLLDTPGLSESVRASLQMIMQNAERMGRQTGSLLDLAKGIRASLETASIGPIIAEICHSVQSDCRKKNISFETQLDASAPVLMDSVTLQGAIHNLVNNAIEALPEGGQLRVISASDPDHVHIRVEDSGPGLTREQLKKIQSPFHTTKKDGTGLGLFIARQIVKEHKGTLTFESQPGRGTTVTVELPVARAA